MSIAEKLRNLTKEQLSEAVLTHKSFTSIAISFGGYKDKFCKDIIIAKCDEYGLDYSHILISCLRYKKTPPVELVCVCGKSYTRTRGEYNKSLRRTNNSGVTYCSTACSNKATNTINKLRFMDVELIQNTVNMCESFQEILDELGCKNLGGNIKAAKIIFQERGITYPHITEGKSHNNGKNIKQTKKWKAQAEKRLELNLIENSKLSRGSIKRTLLQTGILKEECVECKMGPLWNSKPLVLHLDHINGVKNDNRLENLRLLCPNCHSQTETYAGRNMASRKSVQV